MKHSHYWAVPAASLLLGILALTSPLQAGLYYSGEVVAPLPSQWRGFLIDQRNLRVLRAGRPSNGAPSPFREQYESARRRLEEHAKQRPLSAAEAADLGALCLRLGHIDRGLEVLRSAVRRHPDDFRLLANLGTAWQLQGDLAQAAYHLRLAVKFAPADLVRAEAAHLRLVQLRSADQRGSQRPDDLFGLKWSDADAKSAAPMIPTMGKLNEQAVATTQQLALWLPADGRLMWLLAELALVYGDVRTAAAMLDGCVTDFGMSDPLLRERRRLVRAAADAIAANNPLGEDKPKRSHDGHELVLRPRSKRPLLQQLDEAKLPVIQAKGENSLPWPVLGETTLDRGFKPGFSPYLKQLEGKRVVMHGFLQPLSDETELASSLVVEFPIGCWYCEMPDIASIVFVELPEGKTFSFRRGLVKVTGILRLNAVDPESFLYTIEQAAVSLAD